MRRKPAPPLWPVSRPPLWPVSRPRHSSGLARAYIIHRREQPQGSAPQGGGAFGNWKHAGMALETHALLSHQSEHREIEYQAHGSAWAVIGVNSAGISATSNIAAVVL